MSDDWIQSEKERWFAAMKAKCHMPRMDGDKIDMFVCDIGFHNGPGCEACGESWCQHCDDAEEISECSRPVLELIAN